MADFVRSLFESALKTNEFLEFAVITGCLGISRESIFTELNNVKFINNQLLGSISYYDRTEKSDPAHTFAICYRG